MPSANLRNSGSLRTLCGGFAIALHECFRHARGPGDDRLPHRHVDEVGRARAVAVERFVCGGHLRDAIRKKSNAVGRAPGPQRNARRVELRKRTLHVGRIDGLQARSDEAFGFGERRDEPFVGRARRLNEASVCQPPIAQLLDLDRTEVDVPGSQIGGRDPAAFLKVLEQVAQPGGKLTCNRRRGRQRRDDQDACNAGEYRAHVWGHLSAAICLGYTLSK